MSRRRLIFLAGLLAVLGGVAFAVFFPWRQAGTTDSGAFAGAESPAGPEIVLHDVEMREIRRGEATYRLVSERATYRVIPEKVSASGVTVVLQGKRGEVVVRAPEARWDMRMGQIVLPAGGTAEDRAGWSAFVDSARISLATSVFSAPGEARLSGPGLAVAGDNLVWNWMEGKMELERPKTRVLPARALGGKG
ncbi:MAG: hypothetical protein HY896_12020 [Deltaproteobacteria bacterium]|nr:hypothetical protein [Deltaproteobacteria bacterium]